MPKPMNLAPLPLQLHVLLQENNVQAIAAVEKLLHYTEDMVAILTQGQVRHLVLRGADQ